MLTYDSLTRRHHYRCPLRVPPILRTNPSIWIAVWLALPQTHLQMLIRSTKMGGIRSQNHHHHQHGCRRRRHHLDIYGWGGRSDHGTPLECSSSSHSTTPKVSAMELCFCFNISKDYCDALQALCSHNPTYYATTVIHVSDNELSRVCSDTETTRGPDKGAGCPGSSRTMQFVSGH